MSLKEDFEEALAKENSTNLDRIEARSCGSDNYSGVQYNFYGEFFSVRPIIDVVADAPGRGIEHMHFTNDTPESCFGVFVAHIPEQPHPAFVNE